MELRISAGLRTVTIVAPLHSHPAKEETHGPHRSAFASRPSGDPRRQFIGGTRTGPQTGTERARYNDRDTERQERAGHHQHRLRPAARSRPGCRRSARRRPRYRVATWRERTDDASHRRRPNDRDSILEWGRAQLTSRTLTSPVESFTMWLIPASDGSASGEIRFAWGTREFSAPWKVK
jgi:hypothetical protein